MRQVTAERGPVPGDVVRVAAAGSVVVGIVTSGGVAGALFFLVLGGALVPRFLRLPPALDLCFGTSLLLAAWAAQLGWYETVPWLDLLVHAVCTGLVAAVGVIVLVRGRMLALGAPTGRTRVGLAITTAGIGALSAILWEVGEWAGHTFLDDGIDVGYTDTVTDLAVGLLGATLAGITLAYRGSTSGLGRDA